MLIKILNNEIAIGWCLSDVKHWLPRVCRYKADMFVSWLGGCIVWSRIRK